MRRETLCGCACNPAGGAAATNAAQDSAAGHLGRLGDRVRVRTVAFQRVSTLQRCAPILRRVISHSPSPLGILGATIDPVRVRRSQNIAAWAAGIAAAVIIAPLVGCEEGERRPAGTTADPVERCEAVGEVCRIDEARLGVCHAARAGAAEGACEGEGCFACTPQH